MRPAFLFTLNYGSIGRLTTTSPFTIPTVLESTTLTSLSVVVLVELSVFVVLFEFSVTVVLVVVFVVVFTVLSVFTLLVVLVVFLVLLKLSSL
jgi:hypothetical protein